MAQLKELLANNTDVFAVCDNELGCTDLVKHMIDTGDHPLIKQQPHRTNFKVIRCNNDVMPCESVASC